MLAYHQLDRYLVRFPQFRELILELRNLIAQLAPDAQEILHRYGLTYYQSTRGGPVSGGVCQIQWYPDHIRFGFVHGAFLPDPHHLLQGDQKAKRYVRLSRYEDVPWENLSDLIRASIAFDPHTIVSKA